MRSLKKFAVVWAVAIGLTACNSNNGLPETVDVELPDGTVVQSTLGSGVISFADSRWEFFRASSSGQSAPFMTVVFGSRGELSAFENNTIASDIFGDTILFDGELHPTSQFGLSYAAATFGAQTADSQGFAFEGRVTAFAAGIQAAEATASASGTFTEGEVDEVRGTFAFQSEVTLLDVPEGNTNSQFTFVGRRVE